MPPDASPETTCWKKLAIDRYLIAEVALPARLVVAKLAAGSRDLYLADLEHVGALRRVERDAGVLLDDEHGKAVAVVELADDPEDLAHDQGREPQRGLVEHQQSRARHDRAREGKHLLLTSRAAAHLVAAALHAAVVPPCAPHDVGS